MSFFLNKLSEAELVMTTLREFSNLNFAPWNNNDDLQVFSLHRGVCKFWADYVF